MGTPLRTCALIAAAAVALASCSPKTPAQTPGATTGASGAATTAPAPAKKTLPTNGKCVLLTLDQATTLLGSTPKSSAGGVGGEGVVHIDGCTYTGAGNNVGYDINDFTNGGGDPKVFIDHAAAAIGNTPGAQKFDAPGGDASIAFTMPVGPKTMARIELAKGKYTIAVNAVSGDPTKAKQIALDTLAILVAAVG